MQERGDNKEFDLEYCPTGEMPADGFTKPKPTDAFEDFRSSIGVLPKEGSDHLKNDTVGPIKERAEIDADFGRAGSARSFNQAFAVEDHDEDEDSVSGDNGDSLNQERKA
jgi:hypothetical protein